MSESPRPIIIRRKKVYAATAHHGGAWKVAYADFVTAMMAFFLLMWLLNATTEEQRKGIADYFNPNIPVAAVSGGGAEALQGNTIHAAQTLAQSGLGSKSTQTQQGRDVGNSQDTPDETGETESVQQQLAMLNDALNGAESELLQHIHLKLSPDGLVIELVDNAQDPLFAIGRSEPLPLMKALIPVVANALSGVQNPLKIVGHTDALTFPQQDQYGNWELSADRANSARRLMMASGGSELRVMEVSGMADRMPVGDNPYAAQNRRISITLLNIVEPDIHTRKHL